MTNNRSANGKFASRPLRGSVPQVARHLGVSPRTLNREIAAGKLPYIVVGTRKRILWSDVYEYERAHRGGAVPDSQQDGVDEYPLELLQQR